MPISSALKALFRKMGTVVKLMSGEDSLSVREYLAKRWLKGDGIEVGALDKPLPPPKSVRIRYVDRMSKQDLLKQYPELKDHPLVTVDIISDGESLNGVPDHSQDFVIANHFLEHCQDPIGTLKNFCRVVRVGGILFITIPDMRFTFDKTRDITTFEHLLADNRDNGKGSKRRHFEEWVSHVGNIQDPLTHEQEVKRLIEMDYSIHFHTFTSQSFLDMLVRLGASQQIPVSIQAFLQNEAEMICVLRRES